MGKTKGFYTKDGKKRPITSRKPHVGTLQKGTGHLGIPRRIRKSKPISEKELIGLLLNTPILGELRAGYEVADAIFENWNLITKSLEAYQKNGVEGIAEYIGTDFVQNKLSSIQSQIAWAMVKKYVPEPYHDKGKQIVKTVIDEITPKEIETVKAFLNNHRRIGRTKSNKRISSNFEDAKKGMPKGVDYV